MRGASSTWLSLAGLLSSRARLRFARLWGFVRSARFGAGPLLRSRLGRVVDLEVERLVDLVAFVGDGGHEVNVR